MAATELEVEEFLKLSQGNLILDVRSPSEYQHAHIPNARSFPLFTDEERKIVGTTYKQQSRELAIQVGLEYFGPKMKQMVLDAEVALKSKDSKKVFVHCWRGGMRSAAVSWLLDLYGFEVFVLKGGYKTFRGWVLSQFDKKYDMTILSGFTGCGKTEILHELEKRGEAIIDLEEIASHRGSTFGALGMKEQPSSEQFENELALTLYKINHEKKDQTIWLESESSRIGRVNMPYQFFNKMKEAKCIRIEVPLQKRLQKIIVEYGCFGIERLKAGVLRIQKRLGGLETKNALEHLNHYNLEKAFEILIKYYDKTYSRNDLFQPPFLNIKLPDTDSETNANIILNQIKN